MPPPQKSQPRPPAEQAILKDWMASGLWAFFGKEGAVRLAEGLPFAGHSIEVTEIGEEQAQQFEAAVEFPPDPEAAHLVLAALAMDDAFRR